MKIVFVNPSLNCGNKDIISKRIVGNVQEPLGLAYLGAVLEENGDVVEIIDAEASDMSYREVAEHVSSRDVDVVGITMTTMVYSNAVKTIKAIKSMSNPMIIVGGAHPTALPIETLKEVAEIDAVVIGEGETTIVELINAIKNNEDLKNIKGIAYRNDEEIFVTEKRPFIEDLDTIPFPARHLLPMDLYRTKPSAYEKFPTYSIVGSRGCPFRCTFCAILFGKSYRYHSAKRICDEMEHLINNYGAKGVVFKDDSFTLNRKHATEICHEIINRGINEKISISIATRVNLVDKPLLELLKKAGCWLIHYGVESGNQRLIDLIHKDIKLDEVKQAIKWTRETGIISGAYFILGLPSETREETLKTIEFAKSADPDWVSFTITTPYPGSELYNQLKKASRIKTFNWEIYNTSSAFSDQPLPYITEGRTEDELKKLVRKAFKQFYFRPKIIIRHLIRVRSYNSLKRYIKGGLNLL
jgi:anaerobic magnesium-protoporphyrin IX monomethyl ester cyclase